MKMEELKVADRAGARGGGLFEQQEGSGADTAASFCDAYLQALGNKFVLCQGGSKTTFNAEIQAFDFCAGISGAVALGKLSYSPLVGQACLSEIAATDCGTLRSEPSPPADCLNALTGTGLAGDTCYPVPLGIADECAPGNRCVADTQCPGVCQPVGGARRRLRVRRRRRRGGSVRLAPLLQLHQRQQRNVRGASAGRPGGCRLWRRRASAPPRTSRLVCDGPNGPLNTSSPPGAPTGGTCQKALATGPCWQDSDCSTNHCVLSGSGTTAGVCALPKPVGAACVPGQTQCGNGAYCGTANKCVDLPVIGQSCVGNAGEGTYCANGVLQSADVHLRPVSGCGPGV